MVGPDGYRVFPFDPEVLAWAEAAWEVARAVEADPAIRAQNLRHSETWFVGVDALPNAADGSIGGVPLCGKWCDVVRWDGDWHPAQLSIVYPGYPGKDAEESAGNHRFRKTRFAAHVDGLLPIGPERRRYLKESHAFILGLPLNAVADAPLMVWPGSHVVMGAALRVALSKGDPAEVDVTAAYQQARRAVFAAIEPVPVVARPGQAILLHRHLLHGMGLWEGPEDEGRMIAYFRPQTDYPDWLSES